MVFRGMLSNFYARTNDVCICALAFGINFDKRVQNLNEKC